MKTIDTHEYTSVTVATAKPGAFASSNADLLQALQSDLLDLARARSSHLVLDLAATDYFGSVLMTVLLAVHRELEDRGFRLILCGLNPQAHAVIDESRLDHLLSIVPSAEDALAAIEW